MNIGILGSGIMGSGLAEVAAVAADVEQHVRRDALDVLANECMLRVATLGLTAAALQRFLDAIEPGRQPVVISVTPVAGGYSRDTAIAEVQWAAGASERFVLRGDPPPSVFISDRSSEWRLLQALATSTGPLSIPALFCV